MALRVLPLLRGTSGRFGSAQPSWSAKRNPPVAVELRSRHSVSPVLVEVGMNASICASLRTIHGIVITTMTSVGTSVTRNAFFHPAWTASAARNSPSKNQIENGRTYADTPSTTPNASSRLRLGRPVDQSCDTITARAAVAQNTNIVSTCMLATWLMALGQTANKPAATRPTVGLNRRRPITYTSQTVAVDSATCMSPASKNLWSEIGEWSANQNSTANRAGNPTG